MAINKYVYLHKNGKLIQKPEICIDDPWDYFNSPFVVKWWYVKADERSTMMAKINLYVMEYREKLEQ